MMRASLQAPIGLRTPALCACGGARAQCRKKSSRLPRLMSVPSDSWADAFGTSFTTRQSISSVEAPCGVIDHIDLTFDGGIALAVACGLHAGQPSHLWRDDMRSGVPWGAQNKP